MCYRPDNVVMMLTRTLTMYAVKRSWQQINVSCLHEYICQSQCVKWRGHILCNDSIWEWLDPKKILGHWHSSSGLPQDFTCLEYGVLRVVYAVAKPSSVDERFVCRRCRFEKCQDLGMTLEDPRKRRRSEMLPEFVHPSTSVCLSPKRAFSVINRISKEHEWAKVVLFENKCYNRLVRKWIKDCGTSCSSVPIRSDSTCECRTKLRRATIFYNLKNLSYLHNSGPDAVLVVFPYGLSQALRFRLFPNHWNMFSGIREIYSARKGIFS